MNSSNHQSPCERVVDCRKLFLVLREYWGLSDDVARIGQLDGLMQYDRLNLGSDVEDQGLERFYHREVTRLGAAPQHPVKVLHAGLAEFGVREDLREGLMEDSLFRQKVLDDLKSLHCHRRAAFLWKALNDTGACSPRG
jgi:hypothetical protein